MPQPRAGEWNVHHKDSLEAVLCRLVCKGKVGLRDAQQAMAHNWVEAYRLHMHHRRHPPVPDERDP